MQNARNKGFQGFPQTFEELADHYRKTFPKDEDPIAFDFQFDEAVTMRAMMKAIAQRIPMRIVADLVRRDYVSIFVGKTEII